MSPARSTDLLISAHFLCFFPFVQRRAWPPWCKARALTSPLQASLIPTSPCISTLPSAPCSWIVSPYYSSRLLLLYWNKNQTRFPWDHHPTKVTISLSFFTVKILKTVFYSLQSPLTHSVLNLSKEVSTCLYIAALACMTGKSRVRMERKFVVNHWRNEHSSDLGGYSEENMRSGQTLNRCWECGQMNLLKDQIKNVRKKAVQDDPKVSRHLNC